MILTTAIRLLSSVWPTLFEIRAGRVLSRPSALGRLRQHVVQLASRALPGERADRLGAGGREAPAQLCVARDTEQRTGQRVRVPGRHPQRAVAQDLGEDGKVAD